MLFGAKVKQLRIEKGLTQEELAEKLGLAKSTISLYETNKREPETEMIIKIANYFEITVDELLGNTQFTNNPKIVLYGSGGKLVDITNLPEEEQEYILKLAEKFRNIKR